MNKNKKLKWDINHKKKFFCGFTTEKLFLVVKPQKIVFVVLPQKTCG